MGAKEKSTAKDNSIMRKFIYGILVPLVVILAITGVILNFCLTGEIETLQGENLQTETESAVRLIEGYFENYFSMIETTAVLPIVQQALEEIAENKEVFADSPYHDEIVEILVEVQRLSPEAIKSLYLADFTVGQYLRWDGLMPDEAWDITTRPYYAMVKEAGDTIVTPVFRNVTDSTVVSVSTPVFSEDGERILGSVNIDLGIDSLVEAIDAITVGSEGYVMLLDPDHDIISVGEEVLWLQNIKETDFSGELVEKILTHEEGRVDFTYHGVSYCGNIDPVDGMNGWQVLSVMPDTEYHQPIANITEVVMVCFVLCIVLLSVFCILIVRKIIQPLEELSGVVGEIARGNLEVACTMTGDDEIGRLAEGVRILVHRLRAYMEDIVLAYEKLEEVAYKDALTGIGNRVAFKAQMKEYAQTSELSCIVADVNHLKECNDKYGHSEGDILIRDVADCIRAVFDAAGSCYRIGGDEFCVLLPICDRQEILHGLEEVQNRIAEKNQNRRIPLSAAFGYAIRESLQERPEELFNRADAMMYDTKYQMKKDFCVCCEEKTSE